MQEKIEAINQALINDYDVRRKMLLKRLDVTVQSFGWSDRAKVLLLLYYNLLYYNLISLLLHSSQRSSSHHDAAAAFQQATRNPNPG